jgi:competence protein ComEC
MATVLFYCLVVGLEPSVVRALIVIEFIFIARLFERKPDIGNLTAAAALVTILLHPYDLFDIGFQLSYGAVFSLVFLYPAFEQLFISEKIKDGKTFFLESAHRSLQGFYGSLAVFLGLLPVFLYHFHRVSIVGLAINILGIPLAAIITIFGFLLVPISFISNWLASIYGEASLWMTKIIVGIAHFSGSFEWSVIQLPRPQTLLILFYLASIFYIINSQARKNFIARSFIILAFIFVLLILNIPFAYSIIKNSDTASLLFFVVGQGDAMLLSAPNGKTYLVDFGGITKNYSAIADRTMVPLFKAEGIRNLSGGFITHMHIDHYGGAVSMMQNINCQALYTSGERTQGYAAYRLDSISQALHIPVIRVHQGDELTIDKDLKIFILNPETTSDEITLPLSSEGMNHHSLALKVVYKNSSALLLGDIEAADEERLIKRYGDFLRCDVVKVAHHGSHTSSSQEFVKIAKPKYAVISVGKHNGFGHPTPQVVRRWIHSGATVLRTDKEGAILFQSDGDGFKRVEWR